MTGRGEMLVLWNLTKAGIRRLLSYVRTVMRMPQTHWQYFLPR